MLGKKESHEIKNELTQEVKFEGGHTLDTYAAAVDLHPIRSFDSAGKEIIDTSMQCTSHRSYVCPC